MAVVINELEVIPRAPAEGEAAEPSESKSAGGPPDPREIERALERQMERRIRVRAH